MKNGNHRAVILFYHRFKEGGRVERLLPSLDIKGFKKQVTHLKRLYKFISMDELTDSIKNGKAFELPCVALTIDDGYLDNYLLAYPILRQHGIPCLIYLTAGLIGSKNGLWIDDVELGLMHARVKSFYFKELLEDDVIDISTIQAKKKVEKILFSKMLKFENTEREDLIQKLFDILDVDRLVIESRERKMLNWEEIREMLENGVSFGAHTLSHPYLPAMPLEVAKHEIEKSKEIVEKRLGKPVKHFAIPNGKPEDFTNDLREFCEEIGFDTIVTTESGVVDSTSNRFSLKRVLPPPPLYYFACEIAKYLFFSKYYQ